MCMKFKSFYHILLYCLTPRYTLQALFSCLFVVIIRIASGYRKQKKSDHSHLKKMSICLGHKNKTKQTNQPTKGQSQPDTGAQHHRRACLLIFSFAKQHLAYILGVAKSPGHSPIRCWYCGSKAGGRPPNFLAVRLHHLFGKALPRDIFHGLYLMVAQLSLPGSWEGGYFTLPDSIIGKGRKRTLNVFGVVILRAWNTGHPYLKVFKNIIPEHMGQLPCVWQPYTLVLIKKLFSNVPPLPLLLFFCPVIFFAHSSKWVFVIHLGLTLYIQFCIIFFIQYIISHAFSHTIAHFKNWHQIAT